MNMGMVYKIRMAQLEMSEKEQSGSSLILGVKITC
jgi:hypothetical protein